MARLLKIEALPLPFTAAARVLLVLFGYDDQSVAGARFGLRNRRLRDRASRQAVLWYPFCSELFPSAMGRIRWRNSLFFRRRISGTRVAGAAIRDTYGPPPGEFF